MRIPAILAVLVLAIASARAAEGEHPLVIEQVTRATGDGTYELAVAADLDGDGVAEPHALRLVCARGKVRGAALAYDAMFAREAGSALATGRAAARRDKTLIKASPQFRTLRPRMRLGASPAAPSGWRDVALTGADGLCPAVDASKTRIDASRPNIKTD